MRNILILALILLSCKAQKPSSPEPEEDKVYILVDGEHVEMVADEFGNQYLKQYVQDSVHIFIPFPFETEEEDSLRILQAKIGRYDQ